MPELRDVSRQMYLQKREAQKLAELEQELRDEEMLFAVGGCLLPLAWGCQAETKTVPQLSMLEYLAAFLCSVAIASQRAVEGAQSLQAMCSMEHSVGSYMIRCCLAGHLMGQLRGCAGCQAHCQGEAAAGVQAPGV